MHSKPSWDASQGYMLLTTYHPKNIHVESSNAQSMARKSRSLELCYSTSPQKRIAHQLNYKYFYNLRYIACLDYFNKFKYFKQGVDRSKLSQAIHEPINHPKIQVDITKLKEKINSQAYKSKNTLTSNQHLTRRVIDNSNLLE